MEAQVINQFIIALNEVMESIGLKVNKNRKISIIKDIIDAEDSIVLIEIAGKYEGKCFITMKSDDLLKLTGYMNFKNFYEINEMVLSTLCEIGNMVFGKAISLLSRMNYICDISTPVVFFGNDLKIETKKYKYFSIPFETRLGKLVLNLSLQEND